MRRINILFAILIITTFIGCSKKEDVVPDPDETEEPEVPADDFGEQYIGSVVGFNELVRSGGLPGAGGNTIYNVPLYKSSEQESDWWENLVEEIAYSGLDFAAVNLRGYLPDGPVTDHGDPRKLPNLIAAMEKRGVVEDFKIALFDDIPASWVASSNLDKGNGYSNDVPFDCSDTDNYKYIWDYNLKKAFENIPEKYLFKIDGRPLVIFWGVNNHAFANMGGGNLKAILQYIRTQCKSTFGFEPYFQVNDSWLKADPSIYDPEVIDAVDPWFDMDNPWELSSFNGVKTGCAVPGFYVVKGNTNMQIDANNGQTLITGLENTNGAGAFITLLEGFTDCAENAALWRSKDETYYDYPNQRMNIIRRYSKDPYPAVLKVEAEACDFYNDITPGNSGGTFREGDIDVIKTNDTNYGWQVTDAETGEWLEWKELPLVANSKFEIRYSSTEDASVRFSVDGIDLPVAALPATGADKWSTVDAGKFTSSENGLHTVTLTIVSGFPDINYFNRTSF